jgi:hypothetical protein
MIDWDTENGRLLGFTEVIYDNGVFLALFFNWVLIWLAHGNRERTRDVMSVCTSCRS